jgi:hypothetical protein
VTVVSLEVVPLEVVPLEVVSLAVVLLDVADVELLDVPTELVRDDVAADRDAPDAALARRFVADAADAVAAVPRRAADAVCATSTDGVAVVALAPALPSA